MLPRCLAVPQDITLQHEQLAPSGDSPCVWQIRTTDIDTLERCVNAVAYGDLEAEGQHGLTQASSTSHLHAADLWTPTLTLLHNTRVACRQPTIDTPTAYTPASYLRLLQVNFLRIFRLGQLTAQYLLHVQDSLAKDTARLRVRPSASAGATASLTARGTQQHTSCAYC